jgi:hypothetical protein
MFHNGNVRVDCFELDRLQKYKFFCVSDICLLVSPKACPQFVPDSTITYAEKDIFLPTMQYSFTKPLLLSLAFLFAGFAFGQMPSMNGGSIRGSFQSDVQWYFPDIRTNAQTVDERVATNNFLQLTYNKGNFSAGLRYEAYLPPMLGFRDEYEDQGIPYRFATYNSDQIDITVGNFYDQFGSGMVFRAYQEWTLGIDNSIDGVRVAFRPAKGIYTKGFIGKQRRFWTRNDAVIRGADGEVALHEIFPSLAEKKWQIRVGGSIVSKFMEDDDVRRVLPENVSAYGARIGIIKGRFTLDAEFAHKINDPFDKNAYLYDPGDGYFLTAGYSQKGFGVTATIKRINNMDFRSERSPLVEESTINFLPPTTLQHTYRLITLYPYATKPNGEVGGQIDLVYTLKRGSALGGKYGTTIYANFASVHGLTRRPTVVDGDGNALRTETDLLPDFNEPSQQWFQDFSVEITRKISKKLKINLNYINIKYDKFLIEDDIINSGIPAIRVNSFIWETQYKLAKKVNLRTEAQVMITNEKTFGDLGDWAMLLGEISFSPHWFITVWDEWNYKDFGEDGVHYYNGNVAYVSGPTRFALGFGRQRAGLLCVGGICRVVPATTGFTLSVNSSF